MWPWSIPPSCVTCVAPSPHNCVVARRRVASWGQEEALVVMSAVVVSVVVMSAVVNRNVKWAVTAVTAWKLVVEKLSVRHS